MTDAELVTNMYKMTYGQLIDNITDYANELSLHDSECLHSVVERLNFIAATFTVRTGLSLEEIRKKKHSENDVAEIFKGMCAEMVNEIYFFANELEADHSGAGTAKRAIAKKLHYISDRHGTTLALAQLLGF